MVACEKQDRLHKGLAGTLKCLEWLKAVSDEVNSFKSSGNNGILTKTTENDLDKFFEYFKKFAEPLLIAILPEKSYPVYSPDGRLSRPAKEADPFEDVDPFADTTNDRRLEYRTAHSAVVDQARILFKAICWPGPFVLILNPNADREEALRNSAKSALATRNNWDDIETSLRVEYELATLNLRKYPLGDAGTDVAHQFIRKNETRANVSREEVQLSDTHQTNRDQLIYELHLNPERTWTEITRLANEELNRDKNKDNRDEVVLSSDAVKKLLSGS